MSLDVIRTRLDPSSPNHYKDIAGFVSDVRLIFKNTYLFYQVSESCIRLTCLSFIHMCCTCFHTGGLENVQQCQVFGKLFWRAARQMVAQLWWQNRQWCFHIIEFTKFSGRSCWFPCTSWEWTKELRLCFVGRQWGFMPASKTTASNGAWIERAFARRQGQGAARRAKGTARARESGKARRWGAAEAGWEFGGFGAGVATTTTQSGQQCNTRERRLCAPATACICRRLWTLSCSPGWLTKEHIRTHSQLPSNKYHIVVN